MTPRATTPDQAAQAIHDFRAAHPIVAVPAPDDDPIGGYVCQWDGIHVYLVNGGTYRHSLSEVRVLIERAPIPEVNQ